MPLCGKCHRDAAAGALFCSFCGAPIVPERGAGEAADPYIGQTFRGTYFIQQKVGGGGMGQVYKAIHVTLDVPVALKILKKALLADPSVVQRFHREARAASRLRHPNVINVTDFGQTDDGTLFMAMEYVAGKSLGRVIADEFPLSEQRVVHIGSQILAALAEAHAGQILHRDLKPENVMLEARRDEADSVKVLDFGIAKIQVPGDGQGTLTQAGLVCGTPGYMSPEQWSGEPLDARSDLYSVGVILYEMLTGKLPFEAETPMEMVRKHLTERPLPPSERRTEGTVSPDLEALVMRALSASPADRPGSAEEMRADLLACVLSPEPAARPEPLPAKTVVLDRSAAAAAAARRSPSPPPVRPPARADLEAQPTAFAPGRPARPPTPAGPRRPPTGPGAAGRTPPPVRRSTPPPAYRHEADEPDDAEPPPPPETRRSRVALVVGASVAAAAALGAGVYYFARPVPPPIAITAVTPSAVPTDGGTPVLITGTGFADGSTVTIGGTAVAIGERSDTALRVAAPAHAAGPADVVASTPDGRRATLPGALTFAAPPPRPPPPPSPPTLTGVVPSSGPAAGGTSVTLTGTGFAAGPSVSFGGVAAKVAASSATSVVVKAPAHEPGPVDVVVANPDGERAALARGFTYAREKPPPRPPPRRVHACRDSLNAVPTPAAVTGDGVISVQAEPYGDVYLDGRLYGEAPRECRVPAGAYLVSARHPQLGQREQRLTVRAGERVRWTADFSEKR